MVYVNELKMINNKNKLIKECCFMKNGFELANERISILYQLDVKLNELSKVENITDRERLEKEIDVLEGLLHDNKKLLEQLQ